MRAGATSSAAAVLAGAIALLSCNGKPSRAPARPGRDNSMTRTSRPAADPAAARPVVYASVYPLQYFAERIAGDAVEVRALTPVGEDAEHYMPGAERIRALQKADLILLNGALLEKWLRKVMLPDSRVVDTSRPLRKDYVILVQTVTHSHGPRGAHTHEGVVAHTWLDPMQASVQAEEIAKALSRLLPAREDEFRMNVEQVKLELEQLDRAFMEAVATVGTLDRHFLFSHPVYEYFARRYELKATSLHIEPTEMPDDDTFESTKRTLKAKPASYIVWEAPPAEEIAARFREELGLESLYFETCATRTREHVTAGMDYFAVMKRNLDQIGRVFAPGE